MKRGIIVLCISLGFLFLGCGAKQGRIALEPPSPIDENLLDLAPENPTGILWIDVAKFRASSLWQAVEELAKSDEGVLFLQDAAKAGFVDPLTQIDEIVLIYTAETGAFQSEGENDQLLVLLKGSFRAGDVVATLRGGRDGRPPDAGERPFEIKGFPAVRDSEYIVLGITDRTLAIASPESAFTLAERAQGRLTPIENNPEFQDFSIGGAQAVKLRYRTGPKSPAAAEPDLDAVPVRLDGLTGLDADLTLGEGLQFLANLLMENEVQASQFAQELEALRGEFAHNMFTVMIGIEWLAQRITIRSLGKSVAISARLSAADMDELTHLVDRLQKIKQLLETGDQGSSSGTALPPVGDEIPNSGPAQ